MKFFLELIEVILSLVLMFLIAPWVICLLCEYSRWVFKFFD